jgi:hypothetical protein
LRQKPLNISCRRVSVPTEILNEHHLKKWIEDSAMPSHSTATMRVNGRNKVLVTELIFKSYYDLQE